MAAAFRRSAAELLGMPRQKGPRKLLRLLRAGLPHRSLQVLAGAMDVQEARLGELLQISERTMRRRKGGTLRPDESDRTFRVARVFARAIEVLDDERAAREWLLTPNRALGGEAPLGLLDTDLGACQVEDVLGRIEHSVYG